MAEREVTALCYLDGHIKHGPDGVYFEGSTLKQMGIKKDANFSSFLDGLYLMTGLDKETSEFRIFGRWLSVVSPSLAKYVLVPVMCDSDLERVLKVPSNRPAINTLELYLEVQPAASVVPPPDDFSWSMDGGPCKRQKRKTQPASRKSGSDGCRLKKAGVSDAYADGFDEDFFAREIKREVSVHPTLSVAELQKWWKKKHGFGLDGFDEVDDAQGVMLEAKEKAIRGLFGDWEQSFRFIPKLMSALHSSNGMLVDWQYDSLPNPEHASFGSVFWAFSQSVEGFKHCRPVVVVDTKQLKGKYNMKLMIASGFDAANKLFPLAFAVTKEVSKDSWRWFLTRIREKVTQRKGLCLISRQHPDILAVVNEPGSQWQEPWAYHRFCLNHLGSQFSRLFPDHHFTEFLVRSAGSSSQKAEFDTYMKDIKEKSPEGWKWLDQIPPHQWTLAHDSGLRYGVMEIDTEALFAVYRSSPRITTTGGVMLMFDELRDAFDVSFKCSRRSRNRGGVYTEFVMDKLKKFVKGSASYVVTPLEREAFQVSGPSKKKGSALIGKYKEKKECIVQLNESTCTCGKFQRKKFPCLHAVAVCKKMKIDHLQYVDDWYSAERYYKTYAATFSPVPEMSTWLEASGVPTLFPPAVAPPPPLKVSGKGKGKGKSKETPSDEELKNAILDILKAMDFKMASCSDIIKQLADKFRYDLTPRKSSIEVMIKYELEKYAADSEEVEEDDDEEEDEEEEEEEEGLW